MTNELVEKVANYAQKEYSDIATGHDWHHIERVRKNAIFIHSKEGGDRTVIELAVILHDISDYKFNGGNELLGGDIAFDIVLQQGGSEEIADKVRTIVNGVSYKGANVEDKSSSLEAQIVQDADRLDALGAIGIARTFAYGGHVGNPIYNPENTPKLHNSFEEYKNAKSTTINHFYEKLLLLEEKMHTTTAKEVANQRTLFMKDFLDQFYSEWNCNF